MARVVTLNGGLKNQLLPNGLRYAGGAVVILSDGEYSELSSAWKAANLASDVGVSGSGGLLAANNLSDVASASTARTNLGLGAAALLADPITAAHLPSLDGITAPAANVAMNSHKITGLANGSASSDAAAFGQIPVLAASASFAPSNPTGNSGLSLLMMGLGTTCTYTPLGSGKVLAWIAATMTATVAATGAFVVGKFGTGTAPANGAAVTGTSFGQQQAPRMSSSSATIGTPFFLVDRLSLTPNTTYWIDIALATNTNSDTVVPISISVVLAEHPG